MKTAIKVLVVSFIISCLFYFFHPSAIWHGTLPLYQKEALKWSVIKDQIKEVNRKIDLSIENQPFKEWGLQYFIRAPLSEEMVFRGFFVLMPVLFLPAEKRFLKINWVIVLLWIVMFIGSYLWVIDHHYPPLPEAMVMWGGLINGSCIIHADPTPRKRALGMLAAILLHSLANAFYLGLFYLF